MVRRVLGGWPLATDHWPLGWAEAVEELGDGEFGGGEVFEGGDAAEEDVVDAFVDVGGFELEEVFGLLDDADEAVVAGGVGADGAGVAFGEVEADGAVADLFLDGANGVGEGEGVFARIFQEVEGHALGGA